MGTFALLIALLLWDLYVCVSFCIVAGHGTNGALTHPQSQRDLGRKAEVDRCRIILPISTKTLPIPANPPHTRKNHRGSGLPRAAFASQGGTESRPTFGSGQGLRRSAALTGSAEPGANSVPKQSSFGVLAVADRQNHRQIPSRTPDWWPLALDCGLWYTGLTRPASPATEPANQSTTSVPRVECETSVLTFSSVWRLSC